MLAVGICLLTNMVYRSQHCPWHLEEFEKLDSAYVGLVKRIAKLIRGFPTRLIFAGKRDGGLGVKSTLMAAMERKRKSMLELVHRGGAPGIAMEGKISRMMREAGQGGLGPCRRHLWTARGELATGLSSLVRYLKTLGLRIRVGTLRWMGGNWHVIVNKILQGGGK